MKTKKDELPESIGCKANGSHPMTVRVPAFLF